MASTTLTSVLQQIRTIANARAYEETSDRDLLERFIAQREEAAFVALLKRHGPMVLQVCRRIDGNEHDAEDVFQATFLMLARKAGSISKPDSLASWLHGVAYRLAVEAKAQSTQRQAYERQAADMRSRSIASDQAWQGLQGALDEALQQVPEKYRLPLLLCYFEGKTQEEAAKQLGCPLGTVRSRLARGRSRLKEVLERQGMQLSAAGLAAGLAGSAASGAVPPLLVLATARAALAYAAGKAATALPSARAAALVEAGLKAMLIAKTKIATVVLLAIGTLGLGAGVVANRLVAGLPQPTAQTTAASPRPKDAADRDADRDRLNPHGVGEGGRKEVTLRGRVLGIGGKPFAGARLLLLRNTGTSVDLGGSAADGQFTVKVPGDLWGYHLVARAENAGPDFIDLVSHDLSAPIELRLVKDRVIRGRIIDTEGKPAAAVRVKVRYITVYANNALEPFLADWKSRRVNSGLPAGEKFLFPNPGSYLEMTADADGRFVLAGTGAERVVCLRLSGAGIADTELYVVNHGGFDHPAEYVEASGMRPPPRMEKTGADAVMYGPDFSVVVEPEKPIRGVVTEAETGKPRAGVDVTLPSNADSSRWPGLSGKTDAQGRYDIHGARKQKTYTVQVKSDPDSGCLASHVTAADTPGYQPVTADIRMVKGVVVTGRVIDKTSGETVPAYVRTGVLSDNAFAKEYSRPSTFGSHEYSRDDGTFRIVTIPGRVLLMGNADSRRLAGGMAEAMKYKPIVSDPRYPQYFTTRLGAAHYYVFGGGATSSQANYCKVLDIKPGTDVVYEDIVLEQASGIPVKIQDAEDRPLTRAWVTGISPVEWESPVQIKTDSCFAYHVTATKPRLMVFYERDKNLVGTLKLNGDERQPAVVKLGLSGAVTGRLVTERGKPVPGFVIKAFCRTRVASEIMRLTESKKPPVVTGPDGTFRIDDLIPGVEFEIDHHRSGSSPKGLNLLTKLSVKPGETLSLGDVRAKPVPGGGEE